MTVPSHGPALEFETVDDVATALRLAGGRLTAARRLLLQALFAADRPVSAERIAGGLDGKTVASDLASVYRNLERLEQFGVVRHVHAGHGAGLYTLANRQADYIVCDRCGTLEPVPAPVLDGVRRQVERKLGYQVRFSHFPLHGLCPRCAARA
jgi:Fur family ferric uptake transcriptional regulator